MTSDIEKNKHNWNGPPLIFEPSEEKNISEPTVIDLFSGPGGISKGLEMAGFNPILGMDIHEPSINTYRKNHPHTHTILGNVKTVNGSIGDDRDILEVIENRDSYGDNTRLDKILDRIDYNEINLLTAGIPCQGFSIANKKQDDEDERNYLFEELIRAVLIIQPENVLIENVSSMKSAKDGKFVDDIEKCLEELGYTVDHNTLKATSFGVPQSRERLFFIASKNTDKIEWPSPTVSGECLSVNDAISDLPSLKAGESANKYDKETSTEYQETMRGESNKVHNHQAPNHRQKTVDRIRNTKQGEPMYEEFRQRIRLSADQPSPTIIAGGIRPQFLFSHPTDNRGLTVRERARIQSFPDDYEFSGGLTQSRVQTGMAVPPLLAKSLGDTILNIN